jgi:hypothetical protein
MKKTTLDTWCLGSLLMADIPSATWSFGCFLLATVQVPGGALAGALTVMTQG